jgi:hypothetical protein
MLNRKVDLRETVGMVLCALLSLVAFLAFLFLLASSDQLPAVLALAVSLACPVVWLAFLLWNNGSGGGLAQWVKHRAALLRPAPRRDGQPAGVPVEG